MKIDLEFPYSSDWKYGYLVTNGENRKHVVLFNTNEDRSTTAYARYLLSVKLGRYLTIDEEADHKDEDKTNDSVDNLQILSGRNNRIKSSQHPLVNLTCPTCKIEFQRTRTELRGHRHRIEENTICCSRTCGGKFASR